MRRGGTWIVLVLAILALAGWLRPTMPPQTKRAATAVAASTATSIATPTSTPAPTRRQATATTTATPKPTRARTSTVDAACDANIRVKASTTTCPFAENVFYEYFRETSGYPSTVTIRAYSPAAGRRYSLRCDGHASIVCRADDGSLVKFSAAAVAAYDGAQAARYASTHETGNDERAADETDALDTSGDNIPNYANGTGYRVQCADGMYSHSGGRPGACSAHGGVADSAPASDYDDQDDSPDYGTSGGNIPNYDNGTGSRVQCADGMYSHSGGRSGACSGHGGVG